MSRTSDTNAMSLDAQDLLSKIAGATAKRDRTRTALEDECGLTGGRAEAAFQALILARLIEESRGDYVLTEAGRAYMLRKRKKESPSTYNNYGSQTKVTTSLGSVENSSVTLNGVIDSAAKAPSRKMDVTATPLNYNSFFNVSKTGDVTIDKTMQTGTLPYLSAQAHPVRSNSALPVQTGTDRGAALSVRLLLAFTNLRDGLPIPIFDQDKLGRSRENQISLPHDVYLSQSHCRFLVRKSKTGAGYEYFVEDLSSRNGTLVNDTLIEPNKPAPIKHGSRLEIGGLSFVVVEIPN
jgi:hypothetical protein